VISAEVRGFGLHPRIVDGSGLSRSDSASPQQVVNLLRGTWHTPNGHAIAASLPLVGVNGTVRRIGVKTPAQGHCVAKTGTLDYVTNLAGLCHARNGHELAFAMFIDGPDNQAALAVITRMVGTVAGLR
jgi:serine-type D-Ala-D-Ala carboxypeptidase/endopeptidase (penicillin-binding protein 4)